MKMIVKEPGALYIIATPIGNLNDITRRAIEVLGNVDHILAEDTRHSRLLLNHLNIKKSLISLHAHNEDQKIHWIIEQLTAGLNMALISDAGTPLICDPGYRLIARLQEIHLKVVPIPGACALITALSASGLTSDRFVFEGFLPTKVQALEKQLESMLKESRTIVFYEAPHRILQTVQVMHRVLGPDREVVIARELTKTFETIKRGSIGAILDWITIDPNQQRGEFVVLVSGCVSVKPEAITPEVEALLGILMKECSVSQSVRLSAQITGLKKQLLYEWVTKVSPPA